MNQITSLYNPQGNAANAVLGLHPEIYPPDPYRLDSPGLNPEGWVMNIEGKKGELGKEWCGTSNECFAKMDREAEKRTLAFIRKNAEAGKPFFVSYWPNFLNFLAPEMPKNSIAGLKVAGAFPKFDGFMGRLMDELKNGGFDVSQGAMQALAENYESGRTSEEETLATIKSELASSGELICPHGAVAVKVANEHRKADVPMITLATAHPAKFPAAVEKASGEHPPLPSRMSDLYERPERVTRIANDLGALEDHIKRHIAE